MTCPHQSRDRDRGQFKCSLGWYGGRPWLGNCNDCLAAGENTPEARAAFDATQQRAHPPWVRPVSGCCDDARNPVV